MRQAASLPACRVRAGGAKQVMSAAHILLQQAGVSVGSRGRVCDVCRTYIAWAGRCFYMHAAGAYVMSGSAILVAQALRDRCEAQRNRKGGDSRAAPQLSERVVQLRVKY